MIELRIDPEFRDQIQPLTEAEFKQLEENIVADGEVYEPIVTWNGIIVDGHNRYQIVRKHINIPFRVKEMDFTDKWEAFDWMYKKQLGRRNITDEQRTVLIGKMYEARKRSKGAQVGNKNAEKQMAQNEPIESGSNATAKVIAKELGIGRETVKRAEKFAKGIDAIKEVSPEAAETILKGKSGVTKAEVMELPNKTEKEREVFVEQVLNQQPKPTKAKRISNPNIPTAKRRIISEEERQIEEQTARILQMQNDTQRSTETTIDDLAKIVKADGEDYVSSLHNMLTVRSTLLVGDNKQIIANVIGNIIEEIKQVKEMLK